MSEKKEFGDFQTPDNLAAKVVALVAKLFPGPERVVEPTAGLGAFLRASHEQWGSSCAFEGYEINRKYAEKASETLASRKIRVIDRDFFAQDWKGVLNRDGLQRVLVVGNPPWVTNSDLGLLGSLNLPKKTNFQGLRGFDARTGKSNFDIAEWMLIRLIDAIPPEGAVAMLCKTMTARKVLRHFWKTDGGRKDSFLFRIDAKAAFDVAVDACLFFVAGERTENRTARIYSQLDLRAKSSRFGFVDGSLVSDFDTYRKYKEFDGGSAYTWRSGIKHDAAKIMEFTRAGRFYRNGFGHEVELEETYVYPLLKSSDLGNGRLTIRKYVLVTQQGTGDDTSTIEATAPKTWQYLTRHRAALDGRKSSIYQNRDRFSVFGVGPYSFAPWKVAISGLYKSFSFVVVPPHDNKAVMVDDTCYSIPCGSECEARFLCELLSSEPALRFLRSLVFTDSKRPITVDVLRRLSLLSVARSLGRLDEFKTHARPRDGRRSDRVEQMCLLMEPGNPYRTKRRAQLTKQNPRADEEDGNVHNCVTGKAGPDRTVTEVKR